MRHRWKSEFWAENCIALSIDSIMRLRARVVKNCQTRVKVALSFQSRVIPQSWPTLARSSASRGLSFHFQQCLLAVQAPAVAAQVSIGAQNPMAWNCDGHRICGARTRYCAHGRRPPNCLCNFSVGARLTEANALQVGPYATLEGGRLNIDRKRLSGC